MSNCLDTSIPGETFTEAQRDTDGTCPRVTCPIAYKNDAKLL